MSRLPDTFILDNRSGAQARFVHSKSPLFRKHVDFMLEYIPSIDEKIEMYVDEEGTYKHGYLQNRWVFYLVSPKYLYSFKPLIGPIVLIREGGHVLEDLRSMMKPVIEREVDRYYDLALEDEATRCARARDIQLVTDEWEKELASAIRSLDEC